MRRSHMDFTCEPDRDEPGTELAAIRHYANNALEDPKSMRCSTLPEIDIVCDHIGEREDILHTKVYAAFRMRGYNIRYSNWKYDVPDVLYELQEHVQQCRRSYNKELMDFASHNEVLFKNAKSDVFQIENSKIGEAQKDSKKCGIRVSDLNLYNALVGFERFVENDPYYIEKRGQWLIDDCMNVLQSARHKLKFRDLSLQCILNHEDEMGR